MAYQQSKQHGGGGGVIFSDDLTEVIRLSGVNLQSGSRIDAIQAVWQTCSGPKTRDKHGGSGGKPSSFELAPDELIVRIEGRSGSRIDQLTFITNKGRQFGPYGGGGGTAFDVPAPKGVGGFFGRSGAEVDAIGFWLPCP